jgi:hypothetical protein
MKCFKNSRPFYLELTAERKRRHDHCILWRLEPLLCNDGEMGGYIRPVSEQRLGKYFTIVRQQILDNATIGL